MAYKAGRRDITTVKTSSKIRNRPRSPVKTGAIIGKVDNKVSKFMFPIIIPSFFRLKNAINVRLLFFDIEPVKYIERQVFEPGKPGEFEVIAYRAEVTICKCGCKNQAEFPEGVTAAVQYGPATQVVAVYLNQYDFVPYKRVSEYFNTLYKMSVSAGTVANFVARPMKIWLLLRMSFVTPCRER